ncbi:hypothetical protein HOY82DRAFT_170985 [Tuber indicum]|nr:hypothetical protein HOY82DRAFT_170985 [Tuber indicum]
MCFCFLFLWFLFGEFFFSLSFPRSLHSYPLSPIVRCCIYLTSPHLTFHQSASQPTPPSSSSFFFFCNLSAFGISFKKNSQSFAASKTPREISYKQKTGKREKTEIEIKI